MSPICFSWFFPQPVTLTSASKPCVIEPNTDSGICFFVIKPVKGLMLLKMVSKVLLVYLGSSGIFSSWLSLIS